MPVLIALLHLGWQPITTPVQDSSSLKLGNKAKCRRVCI